MDSELLTEELFNNAIAPDESAEKFDYGNR